MDTKQGSASSPNPLSPGSSGLLRIERRAKNRSGSLTPIYGPVIPDANVMQRLPAESQSYGITEAYLRTSGSFGSRGSSSESPDTFMTEAGIKSARARTSRDGTGAVRSSSAGRVGLEKMKGDTTSRDYSDEENDEDNDDIEEVTEPPMSLDAMGSMLDSILEQQGARRSELDSYLKELLENPAVGDDGQPLVEFPPDFVDIVNQGSASTLLVQSVTDSDFEPKRVLSEEERKIEDGLAKIRELDRILSKKNKEAQEITKRLKSRLKGYSKDTIDERDERIDSIDDTDIPEELDDLVYNKTENSNPNPSETPEIPPIDTQRRYSSASVKRSMRKGTAQSHRKFIEKNIQNVATYSRFFTLAPKDNERAEQLLEENEEQISPFGVSDEDIAKVRDIDQRLQKLVPPTEWDSKSISGNGSVYSGSSATSVSGQESIVSSNIEQARDYLKEHREDRELNERMKYIDDLLYKFRQESLEPPQPVGPEDIQRLIMEYHRETALIAGSRPASAAQSDSSRRPQSASSSSLDSTSGSSSSLARSNLENALRKAAEVTISEKKAAESETLYPLVKGASGNRRPSPGADATKTSDTDSARSNKPITSRSSSSASSSNLQSARSQGSSVQGKAKSRAPIPKSSS